MFLAIKFKVRFRYRFCKKYGFVQKVRLQKDMIRHFSLLGVLFTENRIEKAKAMITGFLGRQKTIEILSYSFREFVKSSYQLQASIRRAKSNSVFRYSFLAIKVAKEVRYLQWFYEKKLKQTSGKKSKEVNNILNKLAKITNDGDGNPGTSP
jgi:adenosine deaminase